VTKIKPYMKAAAGFVAAVIVAFLGAKDGGVTQAEWLQIILAGLGGSGLVYLTPNKDPKALHQRESVQPPERGQTTLLYVLGVVLLVLLILWLLGAFHR
jgi:hypothetical protein